MSAEYKNVRLRKDAYELLQKRKQEGESFSEVVERLARERPITDLAGVFTDDGIESIRAERAEQYEVYGQERKREWQS